MPFKKLSLKYNTPRKVQNFLKSLKYNNEEQGETLHSAQKVLKKGRCHCLEGAFLAAAIMENLGYPPLVLSLESQDKLDHVVYVFKRRGFWGSIAVSRDESLRGRPPQYRSLRDVVWSYFDPYIDKTGRITAYRQTHLDDSKADWRKSPRSVWRVEKYLSRIKHKKLKSSDRRYKKVYNKYLKTGKYPKKKSWW